MFARKTIGQIADHVEDVIRKLSAKPAVVGHSFGGLLTEIVAGRGLAAIDFDDPRLSLRLGQLLDALGPALADVSTISLGYEAEAYFADKPKELAAYRRLFDGAVEFLKKTARFATPRTLHRMKKGTVRPRDWDDAARLARRFGIEED